MLTTSKPPNHYLSLLKPNRKRMLYPAISPYLEIFTLTAVIATDCDTMREKKKNEIQAKHLRPTC